MIPTETDRFLAEIRGAAEGGAQIMPYDVLRILRIVEYQGREILRLLANPTEAPPGAAPSLGSAEGSTPSLSCHPHCALFKGLPLPAGVLSEVLAEREHQEAKWGVQNHPWHPPGLSTESARAELRIPSSTEARDYVQALADYGLLSWSAILLEEVAEAVDCDDEAIARRELVQVAAVAVAAVEAIDRRLPPPSPVPPASAGSAPDLSDAAGSGGGSARKALKPGDRVRYYPSGRGHQSHTGTVRDEPRLLGEHTWVVTLHEMDATYKRGECSVVYAAACDALDLIEAAPSPVEGREPPPYDELDPGIRETVRWLYESGFEPCDSGDGRSKFDGTIADEHDPNMFLRVPNVAMVVSPDKLVTEADRLCGMLAGRGIVIEAMGPDEGQPSIQASYDPGRPHEAILALLGVDDALLARHP